MSEYRKLQKSADEKTQATNLEKCVLYCGDPTKYDIGYIDVESAAAELSALRERVEEAELRNTRALEWLEHYPSQDEQEEQAEVNRRRAILILSGVMKVTQR